MGPRGAAGEGKDKSTFWAFSCLHKEEGTWLMRGNALCAHEGASGGFFFLLCRVPALPWVGGSGFRLNRDPRAPGEERKARDPPRISCLGKSGLYLTPA